MHADNTVQRIQTFHINVPGTTEYIYAVKLSFKSDLNEVNKNAPSRQRS